ncbi:MAG: hypothetical protein ACI4RN_05370 [Oscillospiraceae bacterium]
MNFFCIGFFILAFQLNFSWATGYIFKLVGALFILGGVWEMSSYDQKYKKLYAPSYAGIVLSAIPMIIFSVMNVMKIKGNLRLALGLALGILVTVYMLLVEYKILRLFQNDNKLTFDLPAVKTLISGWKWFALFTVFGLVFNIFNVMPNETVANFAGVAMAVSRIIMYILALTVLWRFNKVRYGFYKINK